MSVEMLDELEAEGVSGVHSLPLHEETHGFTETVFEAEAELLLLSLDQQATRFRMGLRYSNTLYWRSLLPYHHRVKLTVVCKESMERFISFGAFYGIKLSEPNHPLSRLRIICSFE